MQTMRPRLPQSSRTQDKFVASLVPEQLQRIGRYTNRKGEVWEYALWRQLYHLFNHSTYHRGQVTNMLRLLEARPAATDFLVFWDEGAAGLLSRYRLRDTGSGLRAWRPLLVQGRLQPGVR